MSMYFLNNQRYHEKLLLRNKKIYDELNTFNDDVAINIHLVGFVGLLKLG